MTPVNQTIIDPGKGNCHQAIIASLFDLHITQVPNFVLYPDNLWMSVYYYFMYSLGYEYVGLGYPPKRNINIDEGINCYFDATVKSKTFKNVYHAVLINSKGLVIHDPNPNKKWLHINIKETGELIYWMRFNKVCKKKYYKSTNHLLEQNHSSRHLQGPAEGDVCGDKL